MQEQKFENEMPDWISAEVEIQFIQGGSWQQLIFQLLRESISVKEKNWKHDSRKVDYESQELEPDKLNVGLESWNRMQLGKCCNWERGLWNLMYENIKKVEFGR